MRILFMTEAWYPLVGGIVWAVDNIARVLQGQGHQVSVVADRVFPETPKEEVINGILVRRLWYLMPTTAISLNPRTLLRFLGHLLGFPLVLPVTIFRLAGIIRRDKPEILNVHFLGRNAFYALLLRPFFPFRLVLNVCGYDLDRYPEASPIVKFYIRSVLRLADRVLAYTDSQLRTAEAIYPGVRQKAALVGQGVDLEEFTEVAPYSPSRPYLLTIANFVYRKGVDQLLRAFATIHQQHPDLDLILVGEGEERPPLEALARELGVAGQVVFFGVASRPQVGALLKGCEFLVLPSRSEGFGMVLIEAMLTGKTAVATRVGGIPEVLRNGERGLLVEPGSPNALAEGILRLLTDRELRARLAYGVAEKVGEEYAWPVVANRYLAQYRADLAESK